MTLAALQGMLAARVSTALVAERAGHHERTARAWAAAERIQRVRDRELAAAATSELSRCA